jgi:hypothetical protein
MPSLPRSDAANLHKVRSIRNKRSGENPEMTQNEPHERRILYPYTVQIKYTETRDKSIYEVVKTVHHVSKKKKVKSYGSKYIGETPVDRLHIP